MSQHFLENIKIENFKCFENLEINDFKRVNVFGGKNNVGKTALLEAIELLVKSVHTLSLVCFSYWLLTKRQNSPKKVELDFFRDSFTWFSIESAFRKIKIERCRQEENILLPMKLCFDISLDSLKGMVISLPVDVEDYVYQRFHFNCDEMKRHPVASAFIKSSRLDNKDISEFYGSVIESDKESFLNDSLNKFDQSLISLKIIPYEDGNIPKIKVFNRDKLVPLSEMGDGISRYVTILCAIWASQNGFLFVDEIENGIHYSNYKKLWELIFMASEQANCQVFVTSHSKECIEAFNNVQQERNDDAGRYFELYRSEKKQRIVAAVRDAEQLHYSLTHGAAIRGE